MLGTPQKFDRSQQEVYKKMLQSIRDTKKRCEESEYAAMNFTPISDYQIGKHLGSGAFGQVKMATHKSTGLLIAFKIYDKQKLEKESRKKCV